MNKHVTKRSFSYAAEVLLSQNWKKAFPKDLYSLSGSRVKAPSLRLASVPFTCWTSAYHQICGNFVICLEIAGQSWRKCVEYYLQNSLQIKFPNCLLLCFFNHLLVLFTNLHANGISKHGYLWRKQIIQTYKFFHTKWNMFCILNAFSISRPWAVMRLSYISLGCGDILFERSQSQCSLVFICLVSELSNIHNLKVYLHPCALQKQRLSWPSGSWESKLSRYQNHCVS